MGSVVNTSRRTGRAGSVLRAGLRALRQRARGRRPGRGKRSWIPGQVEDGATGLSYLNARYYDTDAGVFLSPDPIYDTSNIKSLNPDTYGQGAPTAFSDASGLSARYTFGVEMQNWKLGYQNKQLMGHIEYLGGVMTQMQGIIVQQQNAITGYSPTWRPSRSRRSPGIKAGIGLRTDV